jgi:hypothetical protein
MWEALLTAGLAGLAAGFFAWWEQQGRTLPLDMDGWGVLVLRQKTEGWAALFSSPSLWKGPYVPFVFGLCYLVAPFDESVLVFHAIAFGLAAGIVFATWRALGVRAWVAGLAIVLWVLYYPHWALFGYYFAEPFLSLSVAMTFTATVWAVTRQRPELAIAVGVAAGALLLAKAAFVLAVALLLIFLVLHFPGRRIAALGFFSLGFAVVLIPWPMRNYIVYREVVPFTVEGGKVLFEGSYVPGDDLSMNELRKLPDFIALEKEEAGKNPFQKDRYWRQLAIQQIKNDPGGQLRLVVRKMLRFWVYLPQHSWVPTWKTTLAAAVFLPLAAIGFWVNRRPPLAQLCALWVIGLWIFHGLLRAELRYHFPIFPFAMLLAVAGAWYLVSVIFLRHRSLLLEN